MKTTSGKPISTKPVSLSKAAKILSKFISAENGASQVISAYLYQASTSFDELNQLHKELKSSHYNQKRKGRRSETDDDRERIMENFIKNVEISQELNHGAAQSKNNFKRHQLGYENTGENEEKPTQTVDKLGQEPNDAVECHAGNEGGTEKHKRKKKKQIFESREHGDNGVEIGMREDEGKLKIKALNEDEEKPTQSVAEFSQEPNYAVGYHAGNEGENEKHKKKKKKHHEVESREHEIEIGAREKEDKLPTKAQERLAWSVASGRELGDGGEDMGMEKGKRHKREKKRKKELSNSGEGENGDLDDSQKSQSKKKKR